MSVLELFRTPTLKPFRVEASQRFTTNISEGRSRSSQSASSGPICPSRTVRGFAASSTELDGSCKLSFDLVEPEAQDKQLHGQSLVICHGLL